LIMNRTTTTALPVHITPHHLSLSPALREFVHSKLAKVPRFAADALLADIVLRRHHGTAEGKRFSASARLALPGRDIHASAEHSDLYTAIVNLVAKLTRRSRERKTRFAKARSPRGAITSPIAFL
jgi:ribosome hibernation promoting factor